MKDIPAQYDPHLVEKKIYEIWEKNGFFHADEKTDKNKYSIVIPPPNVTGVLHVGHALNNTIQDILIRWKKMQGFEALWMPGTDHAGIATQNVVERKIAKEGLKKADLGREKFLEKVWEWKEDHGNTIIRQLKRLGCSCDWDRTRFTMDEGLSNAVKEVFVRLYKDALLYKGDYIINWCPRCETALSDEEAEHRDVDGMLYYIKYPIKGREKLDKEYEDYIVIATTRPETMLGDVAVAVNPKDTRFAFLEGKTVILPILKRELRVVFDESVDPEFGTGALKVTPAHDPVDFELGQKNQLANLSVMDQTGKMNEFAGQYAGMDRFECRETIIEDLIQRKLFIKSEKHVHAVGHCYRCNTVVEPRLSKQWFVKMKPLAVSGVEAVNDGKIKFYPDRWTKVYLNWMNNIRDWCISRQIWWGHRIPVWYCKDCLKFNHVRDVEISNPRKKGVYVGDEIGAKCPTCGGHNLEQDPDVLDTWFSSWLWPFSTLGWPEKTPELEKFYPTDVLVTAPEIIFFWVARMIMAGLKFMGDIPFTDVYIHGTVRDSTGTKMSKSLGNVIDPLDVIKDVGSDALRFSMISITSQGQDVYLSESKFDLGRNFSNKLWNASRYVLLNLDDDTENWEIDTEKLTLPDKWILHTFDGTVQKVTRSLELFRFNEATSLLYEFTWHKYCDWYLEITKLAEDKENTQKILVYLLKGILRLLHPFMPFITEEIWQKIPGNENTYIMTSAWPLVDESNSDSKSSSDMDKLIDTICAIRNTRSFWNIKHNSEIDVHIAIENKEEELLVKGNLKYIKKMARCNVVEIGQDIKRPKESVTTLIGKIRIFIPLSGEIDVVEEKQRVEKKIDNIEKYLITIEKKLSNKAFVKNAPQEVIEKEESKRAKYEEQLKILKENLFALK